MLPVIDPNDLVEAIARRVVELLNEGQQPNQCDQDSLPPGVPRRRYLAAVRKGEVPAVKLGRRFICKRTDIEAWLAKYPAPVMVENDDGEGTLAGDLAANGLTVKR